MKKVTKIFLTLIVLIAIPALASLGIMALWNSIVTSVCGFTVITFTQAVGLFLLGQLLSSGFIIALFIGWGSLHAIAHHRGDMGTHWHNMTDEERRDFILRRRARFGFNSHPHYGTDAADS